MQYWLSCVGGKQNKSVLIQWNKSSIPYNKPLNFTHIQQNQVFHADCITYFFRTGIQKHFIPSNHPIPWQLLMHGNIDINEFLVYWKELLFWPRILCSLSKLHYFPCLENLEPLFPSISLIERYFHFSSCIKLRLVN